MREFDLSLRSSRSSYFATFRHQLTILSKTDALDEEKWLNMLGTFVKDWFRYESHFVHGRDSLVEIGRAVQQECRDRSRMPSSAGKKKDHRLADRGIEDASLPVLVLKTVRHPEHATGAPDVFTEDEDARRFRERDVP